MKDVRFTPGPWGVTKHNQGHQGDGVMRVQHIVDADHCTVVYSVSGTNPEANANLIAAAPEMYEALEGAEGHIVSLYRSINPHANTETGNRMADTDAAVLGIRAALRKARKP